MVCVDDKVSSRAESDICPVNGNQSNCKSGNNKHVSCHGWYFFLKLENYDCKFCMDDKVVSELSDFGFGCKSIFLKIKESLIWSWEWIYGTDVGNLCLNKANNWLKFILFILLLGGLWLEMSPYQIRFCTPIIFVQGPAVSSRQ